MRRRPFIAMVLVATGGRRVRSYSCQVPFPGARDFVLKTSRASISRNNRLTCSIESDDRTQTIIGYGSLLSEKSARTTFPNLDNFRFGRIRDYRRVFGHPGSIFFRNGIADLPSQQIAAVAAEYDHGNSGFVVSAFELPNEKDDDEANDQPSLALQKREAVYDFCKVPLLSLDGRPERKTGWLSIRSTDDSYISKWGQERFQTQFVQYGLKTIWNWPPDSGILPCAVYLRHCYLAAKSGGLECLDSFLDETFLNDRKTTIRWYLEANPHVLDALPPPALLERYNG